MTSQPRQPAGARQNGETVAGRWASKTVPDVNDEPLGFNTDTDAAIGPPHDWAKRVVRVGNARAVFHRTGQTDTDGNKVTTITTDCDDPTLLLLARKGDVAYWSGDTWKKSYNDRRTWAADIAVNMLREGHVATGYDPGDAGIVAVMNTATNTLQGQGF